MTTADNIRIAYQPELYVPREKAEAEVQRWLAGNGRLLTITSPPATGKSWFMEHLKRDLEKDPKNKCLWFDIRELLLTATGIPIGSQEIDPKKQQRWLEKFFEEIRKLCSEIPVYDPSVDIAVLLQELATVAAKRCWPDQQIYFFVDGGDNPTENSWRQITRKILEPLARSGNWRFIVVLRQDQKFHSPFLKRNEHKLHLGTLPDGQTPDHVSAAGQKQVENLLKDSKKELLNTNHVLAIFPGYNWSHTGLNHFLFLNNQKQDTEDYLAPASPDFLEQAISGVTLLSNDTTSAILPTLTEISLYLNREWTIEDLSIVATISIKDVWQHVFMLQAYSLVENIQSTNRFRVTEGVWEFINAALGLVTWAIYVSDDSEGFSPEQFVSELTKFLDKASDSTDKIQIQEIREGSVTVVLKVPPELLSLLLRFFIAIDPDLQKMQILQIIPKSTHQLPVLQFANIRSLMSCYFDVDDLMVMCFDLGVDYDNLPGNNKATKIVGLIKHFQKNGAAVELVNYLRKARPHVSWPDLILGGT